MTITVEPLREDVDAGVIEEARVRQRRQRRIAGIASIAAAGFAALGLALAGGSGSPHPAQAPSSHRPPTTTAPVSLTSASCQITATAGRTVPGPPSQSLLSILGVLRRPATAADALPAAVERSLLAPQLGQAVTLFVNYVRRVQVVGAVTYWAFSEIVTRCLDRGRGAKPTSISEEIANTVEDYGVPGQFPTAAAGTAANIENAGALSYTGPPSSSTITMLVPDKVATVTLHYPAGRIGGFDRERTPAVTVKTKIVGNLMVVTVPRSGNRLTSPMTMTWLSANGTTVKKFDTL
jgi:hypothetical protein